MLSTALPIGLLLLAVPVAANDACVDDPNWRGSDGQAASSGCEWVRGAPGSFCDDQGSNYWQGHSVDGISVKCGCLKTCNNCNTNYCPENYVNYEADVDDCSPNPCLHGTCHDTSAEYPGSNGHTCTCNQGWAGADCDTDVDECADSVAGCDDNAHCINTAGSFSCVCNPGFSGDGVTCTDHDECATDTHTCDPNASCVNHMGSFSCECNPGYAHDESGNGRRLKQADHSQPQETAACIPCVAGTSFSTGSNSAVCSPVTPCAIGFHESVAATTTADRQCTPCTNAPSNSHYTTEGGTMSDCLFECDSGFTLTNAGTACSPDEIRATLKFDDRAAIHVYDNNVMQFETAPGGCVDAPAFCGGSYVHLQNDIKSMKADVSAMKAFLIAGSSNTEFNTYYE